MRDLFRKIANKISVLTGSAGAFLLAFTIVAVWAITGPLFHFSNTWQLVINTGTTIVTFLMVFLIQNTQNRDGKAMQLKLDELIRASTASDKFVDLEDLTDDELAELDDEFKRIHEMYKDNPPQSLHKLHTKIQAAHRRRQR
ncbi:MAG TPA: low affinity iron permease family protein [Candidatus Saccharimonadales bacterium]|nr:low affinity iron permease family protein [Candidatus Saccharimonadales bacterium]